MMLPLSPVSLGATYLGERRCRFCVWAPRAQNVAIVLPAFSRSVPMEAGERGYYHAVVEDVEPGSRYFYRLDEQKDRPDPASRFQPDGAHAPSQIIDSRFAWEDDGWVGLALSRYIIYELHVGTFTPEGTFDAIIPHLSMLKSLGITAVELMPVAQFPGTRNWGYDGTYLYAVQSSYGGPEGLKRLVNACHKEGLAVVLDVVYNHLGPEGNYLGEFGFYFVDRYRTPWGPALNFDGAESDEVRRFFIENALYWITEFHIDALRLDAVHAIIDLSARPFLEELGEAIHHQAERLNRHIYAIAESDKNDTVVIRFREQGGYALDSQWSDDFHHALHTLLTGENSGYYQDYADATGRGSIRYLAQAFSIGFVYAGHYSPYRRRRHGNSSHDMPASRFVVCIQNHDQVGNRMLGERIGHLVSFDALKLAAGVVLLSPFIPMLFMGEEYAEPAPFHYFVSHTDAALIEGVRRGRREEFSAFQWMGEVPDPQAEETFLRCKLNHQLREEGKHRVLYQFYQELIRLRKTLPALTVETIHPTPRYTHAQAFEEERLLFVRRLSTDGGPEICMAFHFGTVPLTINLPLPAGKWRKELDSTEQRWAATPDDHPDSLIPVELSSQGGVTLTLAPKSVVLFQQVRS